LEDYTAKGSRWFSTNPRLLKLNGSKTTTVSMTNDEYYCGFLYSGRLGVQYTNYNVSALKTVLGYNTMLSAMKTLGFKSAYNTITSKVDSFFDDMYLESSATNCFFGRGFW